MRTISYRDSFDQLVRVIDVCTYMATRMYIAYTREGVETTVSKKKHKGAIVINNSSKEHSRTDWERDIIDIIAFVKRTNCSDATELFESKLPKYHEYWTKGLTAIQVFDSEFN